MSDSARNNPGSPACVEVMLEHETPRGWGYTVRLPGPDGGREHEVTLSWADHDYWCGGTLAPSRVVARALETMLRVGLPGGLTLPAKFDLATVRRWIRGFDSELRQAG